jgi:hypothetical protein
MKNLSPENGVIDSSFKGPVINLIYVLRNGINAFGLIIGSVALHLVDVLLGGFVLSRVLGDTVQFEIFGIFISGEVLGWMLSIVFWYVQLLLWDFVFQDGISWKDAPALILALLVAVIDTFGDSSAILIGTIDSTLRIYLVDVNFHGMGNLFDLLVDTLFWATVIVTGFNEFLNRLLVRNANITFSLPKKDALVKMRTYNSPNIKKPNNNPRNIDKLIKRMKGVK